MGIFGFLHASYLIVTGVWSEANADGMSYLIWNYQLVFYMIRIFTMGAMHGQDLKRWVTFIWLWLTDRCHLWFGFKSMDVKSGRNITMHLKYHKLILTEGRHISLELYDGCNIWIGLTDSFHICFGLINGCHIWLGLIDGWHYYFGRCFIWLMETLTDLFLAGLS